MNPNDVQAIIDKYGRPAWEAAQRQVWVNVTTDLMWMIALLALAVVIWRQLGRVRAWHDSLDSYDKDLGWAFGLAGTRVVPGILILIAFIVATGIVQTLLNPQWQAIQILASLVPGK